MCSVLGMPAHVRLVRCLLGETAISEKKLEAGNPLVVLGICICLSKSGISMWPDERKVLKWIKKIEGRIALHWIWAVWFSWAFCV